MADEIVYEADRPNGEMLRATRSTYKGKPYIGIRVYYRDQAGELLPGRNGCNLPASEMEVLLLAVTALAAAEEVDHARTD